VGGGRKLEFAKKKGCRNVVLIELSGPSGTWSLPKGEARSCEGRSKKDSQKNRGSRDTGWVKGGRRFTQARYQLIMDVLWSEPKTEQKTRIGNVDKLGGNVMTTENFRRLKHETLMGGGLGGRKSGKSLLAAKGGFI